MKHEELINEVQAHTGIESRQQAARVLEAAVRALGDRLLDIDVEVVASRLPAELAGHLLARPHGEDLDAEAIYERVQNAEGVSVGFAREHAQVVFRVLAEALDEPALVHLRKRLPSELAELFSGRPWTRRALPRHVRLPRDEKPGTGRTLSTGRPPASSRPLSEAGGQRNSVIDSENPHGESKLSSRRETPGRVPSTGRPGSDSPISEKR